MPRAKSRTRWPRVWPLSERSRTDLITSEATNAGLVGGPRHAAIRCLVSTALVKAATKRAGVSTDTELLESALSTSRWRTISATSS